MRCVHCGENIPDGSHFCNFCGDPADEVGEKTASKRMKPRSRLYGGCLISVLAVIAIILAFILYIMVMNGLTRY